MIVEFLYYLCHRVFGGLIVFGCGSLKIVKILQINNSYSLISQEHSYLFFTPRPTSENKCLKSKEGNPFTVGSPSKYGLNSIQELLYIDLLTVYNVDTRLCDFYNATA